MSPVLLVALGLLVLRLVAEWILAALNCAEVRRHAERPPAAVASIMDEATYRQSVAYTLARSRFGQFSSLYDFFVLALVLVGGVLPALYDTVVSWGGSGAGEAVWTRAAFLLLVGLLLSIPGLPFDWWSQFRLEQRYGFNKATPALWLSDKLKGLLLALVIGFPLLWLLLSLVGWVGRGWWLWGAALLFGLQLLMLVLYPKLILPLFNKLSPLPEGELRERLLAMSERAGFRAAAIEVMDGSKRSGHSNAFFTGFGRFRRIVLFDTLIAQLTPEELEAVLAHEIGHYRRGHIPQRLAVAALTQFGGFALIAWLAQSNWFNPAFGFPLGELAPTLLLFGLLSGGVTFWLSPLGNYFSRKHEYEADAFARDAMGGGEALVSALHKLAQKNLSNLTPHPWYSSFYYSHPTILERERSLRSAQ
ncbi:peptidase M48 [Cephaloticoccus primus]|uniref:Peptidase M48 n=1 Tax=Cephaloticoccus primus TaxID=1548207 RepID=A0A139SP45_9BACT|nr:M48 family metallopeptidase [Cephaloticoccus primus]KXU36369.1 peptidase M48 [Cephaloticoccus primus]